GQSTSSKARKFGTTGLGLPLVRDLVELHSGEIQVSNLPGKHVRFTVSIPELKRREDDGPPMRLEPANPTELKQYEVEADTAEPVRQRAAEGRRTDEPRPVLLL